jgi:hypothetical protein
MIPAPVIEVERERPDIGRDASPAQAELGPLGVQSPVQGSDVEGADHGCRHRDIHAPPSPLIYAIERDGAGTGQPKKTSTSA